MIKVKRVYEAPEKADGLRVLVDGVWPRGLSREAAALDRWLREVAPSAALRKWFRHDRAKWQAFRARYARELDAKPEPVAFLRARAGEGTVTLLFGAREPAHNNAVALKRYLEGGRGEVASGSGGGS